MHYYVDGYNLMFRLHLPVALFSDRRTFILQQLREQATEKRLSVTVIFDAQYTPGEELSHHLGDLEVRYTAEGETTDEWIIERLITFPQAQTVVVTSDRALAKRAEWEGARSMTVEAFMSWLEKKKRRREPPPKEREKMRNWWIDYYQDIFERKIREEENGA